MNISEQEVRVRLTAFAERLERVDDRPISTHDLLQAAKDIRQLLHSTEEHSRAEYEKWRAKQMGPIKVPEE